MVDKTRQVKIGTNQKAEHCFFTIPKFAWRYFNKSGLYDFSVSEDGRTFTYTAASEPLDRKKLRESEVPVFPRRKYKSIKYDKTDNKITHEMITEAVGKLSDEEKETATLIFDDTE